MTDTRTERFSGTKEMDDRLALDIPRLEAYLATHISTGQDSAENFVFRSILLHEISKEIS